MFGAVRSALIGVGMLVILVACGQEPDSSPDPESTETADATPVEPDVTAYLEAVFNYDAEALIAARDVVSPDSPAARYLLHAERSRLAYVAAGRIAEFADEPALFTRTEDGYDVCFQFGSGPDCQRLTDFEFDDDGRLIRHLTDGLSWADDVITFAEGATWIETDAAMIELTSVSVGTTGTLRMTLRHLSLADGLLPDTTAALAHRSDGLGAERAITTVDYVYGSADAASTGPVEVTMLVLAPEPTGFGFGLDDHIGIPLVGDSASGFVWIDLRTGRGSFELEPIDDEGDV